MRKENVSRRNFLAGSTVAAAVASGSPKKSDGKPALLGGSPVKADRWPSWPKIRDNDEKSWIEVLKEGRWNRMGGRFAEKFESIWGSRLGAKHCLATANGTSALFIALNVLDLAPGD